MEIIYCKERDWFSIASPQMKTFSYQNIFEVILFSLLTLELVSEKAVEGTLVPTIFPLYMAKIFYPQPITAMGRPLA